MIINERSFKTCILHNYIIIFLSLFVWSELLVYFFCFCNRASDFSFQILFFPFVLFRSLRGDSRPFPTSDHARDGGRTVSILWALLRTLTRREKGPFAKKKSAGQALFFFLHIYCSWHRCPMDYFLGVIVDIRHLSFCLDRNWLLSATV